ncbi:hypothetical protein BHE74_00059309 [Ensete ventricosum]|nr:hypothetical protein GW17_00008355 [Ensete ventricosum]RWW35723.1 hypothetical protein BHE74_00059309 [Ensete ventricosum]RZR88720.1 hypothetical protein BHM03_00016350 [Ensete ventricosum]
MASRACRHPRRRRRHVSHGLRRHPKKDTRICGEYYNRIAILLCYELDSKEPLLVRLTRFPIPSLDLMAALRKTLARRLASLLRPSTTPAPASRPSPPRRSSFLQKRPFIQPALPPDRSALPYGGDRIAERIRGLCPDRILLDGLLPPPPLPPKPVAVSEGEGEAEEEKSVSLEEVRKVVRASQVAAARARLVATGESCVPYADFVRICCEASNGEQGLEIARSLDKSGIVIVLGNAVFLRPEEVFVYSNSFYLFR